MASQTGQLMATIDAATFTAEIAEEAFVDATAVLTSTSSHLTSRSSATRATVRSASTLT